MDLSHPLGPWRAFGARAALAVDFGQPDRPALVTQVLAACATGGAEPDPEALWRLTVSERIAALFEIAARSEGASALVAALCCASCGAPMEIALPYAEVLRYAEETPAKPTGSIEVGLSDGRSLRLRRPTGADQRRWRGMRFGCPEEAIAAMVATLASEPPRALAAEDRARIAACLEDLDPLVTFHIESPCPGCLAAASLSVDLEALALRRLRLVQAGLVAAVHRLASRYGWTELEILSVPAWRRAQYLEHIEAA